VAPEVGAILDVIVDEGEIVDQFHRRRGGEGLLGRGAYGLGREEAEPSPDPFPGIGFQRLQPLVQPSQMVLHHAV
jgi:hypothetical protein